MDARSIIARLRRQENPTEAELRWFAQGLADGAVSDAQAGAFAMAVCLNGLGEAGRRALTLAMRDSGDVLEWHLPGPVIDKHSTGGVGDCVSLLLAPALAVCGAFVPMISGRGLGHTGGTLDKMEAIPGVVTQVSESRLSRIVAQTGCAIVGATGQIAPADRRLYAIRDVTSTVESLDLITASILSKKLAAAPEALVLDVKVGSGAFMKTAEDARALAGSLVSTANAAGCRTSAFITDMSQPLATALGNALEVNEVMNALTGGDLTPLCEISAVLGGRVLADCGLALSPDAGTKQVRDVLLDGRAAERFGQMVYAVGGPIGFVENWHRYLPEASVLREVPAHESGYVATVDGQALGLEVVRLGGGRMVETDQVDPAVGLAGVVRIGDRIEKGQPLAIIHAAREEAAHLAAQTVRDAITLTDETVPAPDLVHERI